MKATTKNSIVDHVVLSIDGMQLTPSPVGLKSFNQFDGPGFHKLEFQEHDTSFCKIFKCNIEVDASRVLQIEVQHPTYCFFIPFYGGVTYSYLGEVHQTWNYHFNLFRIPCDYFTLQLDANRPFEFVAIIFSHQDLVDLASLSYQEVNYKLKNFYHASSDENVFPLYPWFVPASPELVITLHQLLNSTTHLSHQKSNELVIEVFKLMTFSLGESIPKLPKPLMSGEATEIHKLVEEVINILDHPFTDLILDNSVREVIQKAEEGATDIARTFRQLFGNSPQHFQTAVKMIRAKELIFDSEWPAENVANFLGYKSKRTFMNAFIGYFGKGSWKRFRRQSKLRA